jgi:uroporphyrinogen decarboxylase
MISQLKNDRFIRALLRQPVDCTPIWMMRQAGRYLPEYRDTRSKAGDFMTLCKTPELACEVTLQPLERFDFDAAILFSDILTIPDAMGVGLHFAEGEGPIITNPVRNQQDIAALPIPDPELSLGYVMDAVRLIKQNLAGKVPLIGFAGSPWTLATYMVQGGSSKDFLDVRRMVYTAPELMHALLAKLAQAVSLYLTAQIAAGVDVIMIFDTWGGLLSTPAYKHFSLAYMQQVLQQLPREYQGRTIPRILFTKGGGPWLEAMANSGCDALGIDWTINLSDARKRVGNRVAVQGNLDPAALFAPAKQLEQEVARLLASYGNGPGHIFNLGHGIDRHTPIENVSLVVDSVHNLSRQYHANYSK